MALSIAYFAWVRERMGVADEVVELPADVDRSDRVAGVAGGA